MKKYTDISGKTDETTGKLLETLTDTIIKLRKVVIAFLNE